MIFVAHQVGHTVSTSSVVVVAGSGGESWQTRNDVQEPAWEKRWRSPSQKWASWFTRQEPARA